MSRLVIFMVGLVVLMALCSLLTAGMSASASAANGAAISAASTALLVNQCTFGLMMVVVLMGGMALGAIVMAVRNGKVEGRMSKIDELPRLQPHRTAQLEQPREIVIYEDGIEKTTVKLAQWGWK